MSRAQPIVIDDSSDEEVAPAPAAARAGSSGASRAAPLDCEEEHIWRCAADGSWDYVPRSAYGLDEQLLDLRALALAKQGECLAYAPSERARWRCAAGHEWESAVDDVQLRGMWCPHMDCMRATFRRREARAAGPLPPKAVLMRAADACGCELQGAAPALASSERCAWRCSAGGCQFEATLAQCHAVPGWCPTCADHRASVVKRVAEVAKRHKGHLGTVHSRELRWHRHTKTQLSGCCAHGHTFRSTLGAVIDGNWCPTCAVENGGAAAASSANGAPERRPTPSEGEAARQAALFEEARRKVAADPEAAFRQPTAEEAIFSAARQAARFEEARRRLPARHWQSAAPPMPSVAPARHAAAAASTGPQRRQSHAGAAASTGPQRRQSSRARPRPEPYPSRGMTEEEARAQQARLFEEARRKVAERARLQPVQVVYAPQPPPSLAAMQEEPVQTLAARILSHRSDPYRCLGLPAGATKATARKHYLALALRLHPDKTSHPRAGEAFDAMKSAFRILSGTPT